MRAAKGEGSAFKTKSGGYRGYVTVNGKRKYFSANTKIEAAQKRRELLGRRDNGELATGKVPTLKVWLDHWLTITEHAASTTAGYRQYIDHYIDPKLGNVRLDKLTMEHLEQFYAALREEDLGGTTIRKCHSIIRVALKHAVWRGKVARNVAALVQAPSVGKREVTILSEADVDRIIAAAAGDPFEARWVLALEYGLRPSEGIAIEWSDIDFDLGTLRIHQQLHQIKGRGLMLIPNTKTKSGDRTIALPGYLLALLRLRRDRQLREMIEHGPSWRQFEWEGQPRAFVFTQADGSPLRRRLDTTNWKRLLERAGVPHTRPYAGRHTALSMMIAEGVDVATVAETGGHASPAFTLSVYTHAIAERKVRLAEQMEERNARRTAAPYVHPIDPAEADSPRTGEPAKSSK